MHPVSGILHCHPLIAALIGWFVAQGLKIPIHYLVERVWDWRRFFGSGGMPSSHSAMTCAMLMVIGFHEGFASSIFALAFCFSGVVMYDASGVRRATGKNAAVINRMLERLTSDGFNFDEEHLKELVGHTPIQVCAGALLGILVGTLMA